MLGLMTRQTGVRRGATMAAAGLMLAGGMAVTGAPPASATAAQCEHGANGFVDIPDTLSGTVQRSVSLGAGVTVTLQSGTVSGHQRGWAKISGSTFPGDLVWMDWTTNGGASWLQCGPFSVGGFNKTKTSAAKTTSSSSTYQFRACGTGVGLANRCTSWW
jgi:hypothetical protein